MKKLNFFGKVIFTLNSLLVVCTLFTYLLSYIPPSWFPRLSALTLIVPILIVFNVLFCLYWLLQFKRQALLSGIILIAGIGQIKELYKLTKETQSLVENRSTITILSYNVKSFNHKEWTEGEDLDEKIIDFLIKQNADVICLQEYHADYDLPEERYPYRYKKLTSEKFRFGHIIYSKYPIINSGSIDFPESGNNIIYADVKLKNDTIRVYNTHLQSFGVSSDFNDLQKDSDRFLRRIAFAMTKQETQVNLFLKHEKTSPYPVIVAGDFNNSAFSYTYHKMKGEKVDAFAKAGKGLGRTFNFDFVPLRIDFILVDPKFMISDYDDYTIEYSDHYPIKSIIQLK